MVRPAPAHILMSMRGHLGTAGVSDETWQVNVRLSNFSIAPSGLGAEFDDYTADAATWIRSSQMKFTTDVHLDECRFAIMGDTGAQVGDTVVKVPTSNTQGQVGDPWTPFQLSLVVSLIADGRGKGHRGRWYLPPQKLPVVNGTGEISAADQHDVGVGMKSFIDALNNHPGLETTGEGDVVIVGRTGTAGTLHRVDRIRVGRVIDTHRSRRRKLPEQYEEFVISA